MANDLTPHLLIPSCADCAAMGIHVAGFLHDMEAAIGVDTLRDFLLTHGGREVLVPTGRKARSDPDTPTSALDWLTRNVGWGRLTIPKGPVAHRARVSFTVLTMRRDGKSIDQIAVATGIHSRSVSIILKRLAERGLQTQPHSS